MKKNAIVPPTKTPKMILNPKWMGSEDQEEEAFRLSDSLDTYWLLNPKAKHAQIPEEGAWIMVTHPPATEYTVPPLSMWYAVEELRPYTEGHCKHYAKILTPKGDLSLFPREYVIVKDISLYFEFPDDHIHINLLGGEGVDPDKLFYIRSRGISKADAIKMLLGDVKTQNVAYVTIHPAYGRIFCRDREWPKPERLAFHEHWEGEPDTQPQAQPVL